MKLKVKETNYIRKIVEYKKQILKTPEYFPFSIDDRYEFHKSLIKLFFNNKNSNLEKCVAKLKKMNQDYEAFYKGK